MGLIDSINSPFPVWSPSVKEDSARGLYPRGPTTYTKGKAGRDGLPFPD